MSWIAVRPYTLIFQVNLPRSAEKGWSVELFTPEACVALASRNVFPFAFAPEQIHLCLSSGSNATVLQTRKTLASLVFVFGAVTERSRVPATSVPSLLVGYVQPKKHLPDLIIPDVEHQRDAASRIFHAPESVTSVLSPGRRLPVLTTTEAFSLRLLAPEGLPDVTVQATVNLSGFACER